MFNQVDLARIVVDPNTVVPGEPSLSAAFFADASRLPRVGESVYAVQPDDDAPSFIGAATVEEIDHNHQLIILRVDWRSFVTEGAMASSPIASRMNAIASARATAKTTRSQSRAVNLGGHVHVSAG